MRIEFLPKNINWARRAYILWEIIPQIGCGTIEPKKTFYKILCGNINKLPGDLICLHDISERKIGEMAKIAQSWEYWTADNRQNTVF